MTNAVALRVEHLCVTGSRPLVDDVSFVVPPGRVVALFGPSGAGKSSTLLAICGLLAPQLRMSGRIELGEHEISSLAPEERGRLGLSIVLQGLALFPHMTVAQNIAYPLIRQGRPRHEARERTNSKLTDFRLDGLGDRRPAELSGGEQQRVAIARALVSSPSLLLLDEPFKGLDQRLRDELLGLVLQIAERGTSVLLVTHERREIDLTADIVISMREGRIERPPETRCPDAHSDPFRSVEGHVLLPQIESFPGGWVPASDVSAVFNGKCAAPAGPRTSARIVAARNVGGGKIALLCRYGSGLLGWLEIPASSEIRIGVGATIEVEYRQQNGVQL